MTDPVQFHRAQSWYKRPLAWLLFVAVAAAAVFGVMEISRSPPTISYSGFLAQLGADNVAGVAFAGTQIDGRFKQPVAATASSNDRAPLTVFRSRVPDFGDPALLPELRKEHVPIAISSSSAYWWGTTAVVGGLAAILLAKPMLLVIVAAFIAGLYRVARGGKMEMRSTLAMLPMFRSFARESDKQSPGEAPHQPERRTAVEDEMTPAVQPHAKRAWYRRPSVWILGLIIVVALAVFGVVRMNKAPAAISYSGFLDQLDAGNVASITVNGTQVDGRFKAPVKATAANNAAPQTTFAIEVPAFGDPALMPELRKEHVAVDVVSSSNWLSWLGRLPWPMVLIIVALLVAGLVKLARGDKSSAGSSLPTHPMMGMVAGLFGKTESARSSPAGGRKTPPAA